MVEPTRDFGRDHQRPIRVFYAQTEQSVRYHPDRSCRGLQRAEGPIYRTTVTITDADGTLELVEKGRNLCRICRPVAERARSE